MSSEGRDYVLTSMNIKLNTYTHYQAAGYAMVVLGVRDYVLTSMSINLNAFTHYQATGSRRVGTTF